MISSSATAAQEQFRQADGKFGAQPHAEAQGVVLAVPVAPTVGTCAECEDTGEGFQPESGLCQDCHDEFICRECGCRNDLDGDGYDGLCAGCADKEFGDGNDDDEDDPMCIVEPAALTEPPGRPCAQECGDTVDDDLGGDTCKACEAAIYAQAVKNAGPRAGR